MVRAGHRIVFDQDADSNDLSHTMHSDTLEKIPFIEVGNTWDIVLDLQPHADLAKVKDEARELSQLRKKQSHPNGPCSRR